MKRLERYADFLYFFGIALLLLGLLSILDGDSVTFYIIHFVPAIPFITVGGFIITGELILTKHYKRLFAFIIENLKGGTTFYILLVSILAFIITIVELSPMQGLILLGVLLFIFVGYVLVIKSLRMNIIPLLILTFIILKYVFKLSGTVNYERAETFMYDLNVLAYIIFFMVNLFLFYKRRNYDLTIPRKVLSTMVFLNIMLFLVQYNVFHADYYHTQDDITTYESANVNSNSCPEGYGYNILDRNTESFECIQLNTSIVKMRENGPFYLGIIYFSVPVFSLFYSTIELQPLKIHDKNKKSRLHMDHFLDENKSKNQDK